MKIIDVKKKIGAERYTIGEEFLNSISHGIGILLGIVAGIFLISKAKGNTTAIITIIVYLVGMLSSYCSSTIYHALRPGKTKEILRKWDHAAIYLHIAGTYTPFTFYLLLNIGYWGISLGVFIWTVAIVGCILSFKNLKEHSNLETVCYILMGCSIFVAFKPLWQVLEVTHNTAAFYWLIGGGISYIVGAGFYSIHRIRYAHSIFHIFCLGGSVCHIIAIGLII